MSQLVIIGIDGSTEAERAFECEYELESLARTRSRSRSWTSTRSIYRLLLVRANAARYAYVYGGYGYAYAYGAYNLVLYNRAEAEVVTQISLTSSTQFNLLSFYICSRSRRRVAIGAGILAHIII